MTNYADYIVAASTTIYVIVTYFILKENLKTNRLTKQQIEQYTNNFIEEHRPIITLSLVDDGGLALLRIKNEGNRIAENVTIKCQDSIQYNGVDNASFIAYIKQLTESTLTLAANSQWDLSICETWNLNRISPADLQFDISYTNNKIDYNDSIVIHFTSFGWARSYRDNTITELKMINNHLNQCATELHNIETALESNKK